MDKIQAGLGDLAEGLEYVGKKAEDLIGPGMGIGEAQKADYTETRPFSERYPVGPTPAVSVSNEFGAIRVTTWDNRVVQVAAEIIAGAESADVAAEVCQGIDVNVSHNEDLVEIHTLFPDARRDMGVTSMEVNYTITIPRNASLITDNFFGDTMVRGVGGLVAIESQYGLVDLKDISGGVKARMHGEFPLKVAGLAHGGVFRLHGAEAEFSAISGELEVSSFGGKILLRDVAPEASVSVTSDSGPIHLVLPSGAEPDLSATVLYGGFDSDLPVTRSAQGNKLVARRPKADARQRIVLNASFADVRIEREAKEGEPKTGVIEGAKPFNDVVSRTEAAPEGTSLTIDAIVGDLRVEGADTDQIQIKGTRIVWVPSASKAPAALEALELQVQRDANRVALTTVATAEMADLACTSYRMDLIVACPRGIPVEIRAQSGLTAVAATDGPTTVNQVSGAISAEHTKGPLTLSNQNGDITASQCSGPVDVTARYGTVTLNYIFGELTVRCVQGRTVIETPRNAVTVRSNGGDVRILALEGVGGDYDVLVENGNLAVLTGPETDANLTLKTRNGRVHSAIPLNGSITRDAQEFHGRLKDGLHTIHLETQQGDIFLD